MIRKSLTLILLLSMLGCEKEKVEPLNTPVPYKLQHVGLKYPTVYSKASGLHLDSLRKQYLHDYPFLRSTLDSFGFFGASVGSDVPRPNYTGNLSEENIENLVREFVESNPSSTGIASDSDYELEISDRSSGYSYETSHWLVYIGNQMLDTIEVLDTRMQFRIINGEFTNVGGNWFPEIYLPDPFRIDLNEALESLLGREFVHYGWSGEFRNTVGLHELERNEVRLKVLPRRSGETIVLWVVWQIYLERANYLFFVDVISGEVVHERATLIAR